MPKILVVHQDDETISNIILALMAHGFEAVGASSGRAALHEVAAVKFDALVVGNEFKAGIDGGEILEYIEKFLTKKNMALPPFGRLTVFADKPDELGPHFRRGAFVVKPNAHAVLAELQKLFPQTVKS